MGNRECLIEAGWKQGDLLIVGDKRLEGNAHYEIPDDALLLIISQTCDLIQGSFELEPYFEILCLYPLDHEPRGEYLGGKNSRRIEFSLNLIEGEVTHWFSLPYQRHLIQRNLLLTSKPEHKIPEGGVLRMILAWLSKRYTRVAFPESFVSRINARRKPIGNKFSRLNSLVNNVYVHLNSFEELDDDSEYCMDIMLVMDAENFDNASRYECCEGIKKDLEYQLSNCEGIVVDEIDIRSTADVTIEELKGFLDWDYGYLSFREPNKAAMPVKV